MRVHRHTTALLIFQRHFWRSAHVPNAHTHAPLRVESGVSPGAEGVRFVFHRDRESSRWRVAGDTHTHREKERERERECSKYADPVAGGNRAQHPSIDHPLINSRS